MDLLVVIVNYKTPALAIDCLRSLDPEVAACPGVRVVVTDNLSPDDSVPQIAAGIAANDWGDWATLMPLQRNGGFAYGNNAAIRAALDSADKPDYVLMLNPDTVVRPGAVGTLLRFMDEHPDVGIAGSRLEDPDGTPQRSAFRFHSIASEFERGIKFGPVSRLLARRIVARPLPEADCPTDWVSGACLIVRRAVFANVGLLDEKYFMYFEEVDFCLAAKRAGWPCWHVPGSRVVHLIGAASQIGDRRRRRPTYWFDSRRRYFVKNHGAVYASLADLAFATGFVLWRLRRAIQRKPDQDPPKLLGDFIRNSVLFRGAAL